MYGLSGINLDTVEVTRSENLTDFHINIVFGFDQLEINGTYALNGFVGWITLGEFWPQEGACEIPVPKWSDQSNALDLHLNKPLNF